MALLVDGSRSSREIAQALGVSQQAVLRWLTRMPDSGLVLGTEPVRRNRWALVL